MCRIADHGPFDGLLTDPRRRILGLIEKGGYNPSLSLCIRIARALDRTQDQLFWEEQQ